MFKKTQMSDNDLLKLKDAVEKQKSIVAPLEEKAEKARKKLHSLEDKLEKYRVEHGMFYPLSRLVDFKDKVDEIIRITFVQKTSGGKFKTYDLCNDEILEIKADGKFYYSSYGGGIIGYDEEKKDWYHAFWGSRRKLDDFVGFLEFDMDEDEYQVAPPDVETYKK